MLKETLEEKEYEILPIDIGINQNSINEIILKYNDLINQSKYLLSAGQIIVSSKT